MSNTPKTDEIRSRIPEPRAIEDMIAHAGDTEHRCNKALEALDRIARPVWWMQEDQKRKTGSINGINGAMAASLAESPDYLRGIAEKALAELKE